MAINRLGSFDMMSAYNRIDNSMRAANAGGPANKANEVASVAETSVKEAPQVEVPKEEPQELKVNLNLEGMRRRTGFSLDDISRDFAKRESFSMSRVDEKTMQSNMQKAVSDMEKDSSIQQYQYFVGNNKVVLDDEDGIVIMK